MLILLGLVILLSLSLVERVRIKRALFTGRKELPVEPRSSPLAAALAELLAIAGGIYLTLLVTVTFLEIEVPPSISVGSISLEPLAAISLFLAILQPWLVRFLPRYR